MNAPKKYANPHPLQDLRFDDRGVIRFRENRIVSFMLDEGKKRGLFDLNSLACMGFSGEDWEQFAQLIGYSVSGASSLSYMSDATIARADRRADKLRGAREKGGT